MTVKKLGWIGILLALIGIVVNLIAPELREFFCIDENFRVFITILLFIALVLIVIAWKPQKNSPTQNLHAEKEAVRRHERMQDILQWIPGYILLVFFIAFMILLYFVIKMFN